MRVLPGQLIDVININRVYATLNSFLRLSRVLFLECQSPCLRMQQVEK